MTYLYKTLFISMILLSVLSHKAQAQDNTEEYGKTIEMADSYFTKGDYINAKASYQIAVRLAPGEQYPKDRLQQSLDMIKVQMYQNSLYTQKIQVADDLFNKQDPQGALKYYQEALTILPGDVYASGKIQEITRNQVDSQQLEANYQKSITAADKLFKENKLDQALAEYKNASAMKPGEPYPKEKAIQVETLIAEKKNITDEFQVAMRDADLAISRNKYDDAINLLEKAINLMPNEPLPKQKLAEAQNLKTAWESYSSIINAADERYVNKDFLLAKDKYLQAQSIKPNDEYPRRMLEKIDIALMDVDKANRSSYEFTIEKADALFNQQDYEKAMVEYNNALRFKPDADYAKRRINDINNALSLRKTQEEAYTQAIARADNLYKEEKFDEARDEYNRAIGIKPLEQYPKIKVEELNTKLADLATKRGLYNNLTKGADKLFFSDEYEEAREQYREASYLFPKEQYPLDQITMINEILGIRDMYVKAVTRADQLLYEKDYDGALLEFRKAASIDPKESYPQDKIKEIAAINARYISLIADADKALQTMDYQKAQAGYQAALGLKPGESYAQGKITEINTMLGELAAKQEAEKAATAEAARIAAAEDAARLAAEKAAVEEAARIAAAEKASAEEAVRLAAEKAAAEEAARIAAAEEVVRLAAEKAAAEEAARIAAAEEVVRLAAEKAAAEEAARIAAAEEAAKVAAEKASAEEAVRLAAEKAAAEEAARIAAAEEASRLAAEKAAAEEVARLAAEKAAAEEAARIAAAEEAAKVAAEKAAAEEAANLAAEKAATEEAAKVAAEKASAEEAVRLAAEKAAAEEAARIAAAEEAARLAAEKAAAEEAARIAAAEEAARLAAEKAVAEEAARIAAAEEASRLAAEKAASEEAARIAAAEEAARLAAEKAAAEETARIAAAEEAAKKAAEAALNQQYQEAITAANNYFTQGKFEEARTAYQEAGNLKPSEELPKKQIIEIDHKIQAMAAERDQAYQVALTKADNFLGIQDYEMARINYTRALELKPGEAYPSEKLNEVNLQITKKRQIIQEEYDRTIVEADKFYTAKTYDNALESYRTASLLKPEEAYPKEMAARILKLLSERSIVQINKDPLLIANNTQHKFEFNPVPAKDRKSNYIFFKARNVSKQEYKLIVSFGKDQAKNGGVVIKVPAGEDIYDYIIRISSQYKWFSDDNNWISFYPEGGDIEVSLMQVSYSD